MTRRLFGSGLAALLAACAAEGEPEPGAIASALITEGSSAGASLEVTPGGELVRVANGERTSIDRHVERWIAIAPDGGTVAWARERNAAELEIVVAPSDALEQAASVTGALATADRPVFADAHRLVFVGAVPDGVAGIWIVDLRDRTPRPITNAHLRVAEGPWDGFVPPPADPASMRVEDGALLYHDGEGEQRIALEARAEIAVQR